MSDWERFALLKRATMSELLLLLFNMSSHEQIALVTLYKRATVCKMLLLLFKKEQHELFARDSNELLSKKSDLLDKICIFCMFLTVFHFFFPFMPKRKSLMLLFTQSLFFKEQCE